MIKNIKYIGFYSQQNLQYKRTSALSAMSKMNYVSNVISKLGYKTTIVSPSWIIGKGLEFQKKIDLSEKRQLILAPSVGSQNRILTYLSILISQSWLLMYLLFKIKRNEKIIVYHSPWIVLPILLAKKIKGFKIILEVEEIYKDIQTIHPFLDTLEQSIFEKADTYIFSTELLERKLNTSNKPYVVLYGNYEVPITLANPFKDGKIHLVYAGIIDSHKAGAFNAIEVAPYLSNKYVIHVIGFGEVDKLEKRIYEINEFSECKVYYDGIKYGEEYTEFCQSCHIGLSTQNIEGVYVDSSFPSKILSYLALGLNVVSCDIKCVRESAISNLINYYSGNSIEIAESIKKINLTEPKFFKNKILEMHKIFANNIKYLLE
jgi:hypothetical protein